MRHLGRGTRIASPLRSASRDGPLGRHVALHARMRRVSYPPREGLYRAWEPGRPAAGRAASAGPEEELTLIPYFLWANRGRTQMRVWHDAEL